MSLPQGLTPQAIGNVVTFNVFLRKAENSDSLALESMEKYVGTLESYFCDTKEFAFKFVGANAVRRQNVSHYVEMHLYKPNYVMG